MLKSGSYKNKYIENEIEVKEHSKSKTKINYYYNLTKKNRIKLYKIEDKLYKPYDPEIKIYETHYDEDIYLFKDRIEKLLNLNIIPDYYDIPNSLKKLNTEFNSMKYLLYTPTYIVNNKNDLNLDTCLIDE